mmetsp:Transcript_21134/g.73007  ORF Transcript_21134/g.73007 Transcript_21134/m.73007 type:complete len:247 (+) Transcript_21134:5039-5779(+)
MMTLHKSASLVSEEHSLAGQTSARTRDLTIKPRCCAALEERWQRVRTRSVVLSIFIDVALITDMGAAADVLPRSLRRKLASTLSLNVVLSQPSPNASFDGTECIRRLLSRTTGIRLLLADSFRTSMVWSTESCLTRFTLLVDVPNALSNPIMSLAEEVASTKGIELSSSNSCCRSISCKVVRLRTSYAARFPGSSNLLPILLLFTSAVCFNPGRLSDTPVKTNESLLMLTVCGVRAIAAGTDVTWS